MTTGYSRGRPRNGESRPVSPKGEYAKAYRKKRLEQDPNYALELAEMQANWKAQNPERSREINKNTATRKKQWDACGDAFTTPGPFNVSRTD